MCFNRMRDTFGETGEALVAKPASELALYVQPDMVRLPLPSSESFAAELANEIRVMCVHVLK